MLMGYTQAGKGYKKRAGKIQPFWVGKVMNFRLGHGFNSYVKLPEGKMGEVWFFPCFFFIFRVFLGIPDFSLGF